MEEKMKFQVPIKHIKTKDTSHIFRIASGSMRLADHREDGPSFIYAPEGEPVYIEYAQLGQRFNEEGEPVVIDGERLFYMVDGCVKLYVPDTD